MIRIKLKAVLAEKGIKQKDLVEMTGIRQPTLSAFAHFQHIARREDRCKDVQAMQRME